MLLVLFLDIFIALCFLITGFVVLSRDSRAALNRLFFAFVVTISAWVVANYFSNNFDIAYNEAVVANHLTLFAPGMVLIFLLCFSLILSKRKITAKWLAFVGPASVIYVTSLTSLVFSSIERQGNVYAISFKTLGSLYFLTMLANMVLVITVLLQGRKRATGQEKAGLNAIFWGVTVLLVINVATNLLLPVLGNLYALTNIGPLSGIFVVYALWLSIVKHRLFDVRLLIARSLTYALALGTLSAVFILGGFTLVGIIFDGNTDINTLRWVYTILAAGLAFLFVPLRNFFDKITSTIFFRDRYDTEAFIDSVNKIVVGNIDMDPLINGSIRVIEDNIKCEFAFVNLNATSYSENRIVGSRIPDISAEDILVLIEAIGSAGDRVILADELRSTDQHAARIMRRHNIALIARLATTNDGDKSSVGFLALGDKKSGNSYSSQDVNVMRIISGELVIAMQNALRFEEIENFNVTLQEKVNDATRKLQRANDKLKSLDETKDEFISMASHQLRTPLTSVKGYLSMVLEGDAGELNEMQNKLLGQAFTSSQRMVFLIADLLNLSRLRTGKFVIEPKPTNLADLVEGEISQLQETAASRKLKLVFKKPENFTPLMLDETKIRQVVMNFVDNAIYYTPAGGSIEISLKESKESVEFRVHDNGIGVPKDEQHHLFNKFYRAGNARKARPDGTGLGLFMAKKVVVAQGGAIIFDSTEHKGSTFGFTFSKQKLKVPEIVPTEPTQA